MAVHSGPKARSIPAQAAGLGKDAKTPQRAVSPTESFATGYKSSRSEALTEPAPSTRTLIESVLIPPLDIAKACIHAPYAITFFEDRMTEQQQQDTLDQLSINTLRLLAVDQVQKANSGHPGAPLGCAPIAYLLYHKLMKYNPKDPHWIDRDRFILSNGHASALLYGVLHLTGYDLPMAQLMQFRQYGSHTPGHPESIETAGVEVTTGPLGQGFAMAVGTAIAEKHMAAVYNQAGDTSSGHNSHTPVDHFTYVMCGDGDLMEGISHEVGIAGWHAWPGQADCAL